MIQKLKENKIVLYLITVILSFLVMIPLFRFHLTSDGYSHIMTFKSMNSILNLNSSINLANPLISFGGRPLSDFVIYFSNAIGFNIIENQLFFNIGAVIITLVSMYLMNKYIIKITNNKVTSLLLLMMSLLFIFFNAFSFELYLFSVMFSIAVQYLFMTIALINLSKKNNLMYIIFAVFFNFLGACIYQGASVLYLSLGIIIVGYLNRESKFKDYVFEMFKIFLVFGISLLLNIFYNAILPIENRYATETTLFDKIKYVLKAQLGIWSNTFEIFLKYTFILSIIVLLIFAVIVIVKGKKKTKINNFITLFLMLFTTVSVSYLAIVTSGIIIVPRAILIISSIPGLICLYLLMFNEEKVKYVKEFLTLYSIVFYILLIEASTSMAYHLVYTNKIDNKEINQIYEEIKNKNVKYIGFTFDKYLTYNRSNRYQSMDAFVRSFSTAWSDINSFNYYTNENYEKIEVPMSIKNYCSNKNWDSLNLEEQLIIENDRLYICVY